MFATRVDPHRVSWYTNPLGGIGVPPPCSSIDFCRAVRGPHRSDQVSPASRGGSGRERRTAGREARTVRRTEGRG